MAVVWDIFTKCGNPTDIGPPDLYLVLNTTFDKILDGGPGTDMPLWVLSDYDCFII